MTESNSDSSDWDSESLTTNATGDNLPGPGRNLGNLYNFLGQPLEKQINKVTWKFAQKGAVRADFLPAFHRQTERDASTFALHSRSRR